MFGVFGMTPRLIQVHGVAKAMDSGKALGNLLLLQPGSQ